VLPADEEIVVARATAAALKRGEVASGVASRR